MSNLFINQPIRYKKQWMCSFGRPKKMLQNLNITKGLIFSQELMLELTKSGLSREKSYKMVQSYAKKCFAENLDLFNIVQCNVVLSYKQYAF